MKITSYEDLEVYQESMETLIEVHKIILKFPEYERYELASQMRRASKSIPTNIAEGYGKKKSEKDFKSYLAIAQGSSNEMVVHLEIAKRLHYIKCEESEKLQERYRIIGRKLNRLITVWKS